jgi:hypothetical protein
MQRDEDGGFLLPTANGMPRGSRACYRAWVRFWGGIGGLGIGDLSRRRCSSHWLSQAPISSARRRSALRQISARPSGSVLFCSRSIALLHMNYEKRRAEKLHWQNRFRDVPANRSLMTGFVCDSGAPIVAQIANPISMAVKKYGAGIPLPHVQ